MNIIILFFSNLKKMWVINSISFNKVFEYWKRIDYSDYSMCVWILEYDMIILCIYVCLWKYINCKEFIFLLINC